MIGFMPRLAAIVAMALLLFVTPPADAQIYRWTDDAGNAHYADGLHGVPEGFRAKATPMNLRNSPVTTNEAKTPAVRDAAIAFTPGKHILVNATINGSTPAKLYLDTGAAHTLLSPRVLRAAGVSPDTSGEKVEARGLVADAKTAFYRVAIDSLDVSGASVGRMMVSAYDMDMPGVDGLLGQDFLGLFKVTIDSSRGLVTISPR